MLVVSESSDGRAEPNDHGRGEVLESALTEPSEQKPLLVPIQQPVEPNGLDSADGVESIPLEQSLKERNPFVFPATPPSTPRPPHDECSKARSFAFDLGIRSLGPEAKMGKRTMHALGNSLDGALARIIEEYNLRIASLASLTADLPRRLHIISEAEDKQELAAAELDKRSSGETVESKMSHDSQSRVFKLQAHWEARQSSAAQHFLISQSASARQLPSAELNLDDEDDAKATPCWQMFVSPPTHPMRVGWEVLSIILILYDLITIPTILAFKPQESDFLEFMDLFELGFWTLNIFVSLTTGYYENGMQMLRPYKIFMRYLKTWCLVDVVTLALDWTYTLAQTASKNSKNIAESYVKFLRTLRFMRLTRLARMIKLGNAWGLIHDRIYSERIGILFGTLKLLLLLVLVNHLNACLWFVVGNNHSGKSWLIVHGYTLDDVEWIHQYMVAYHWSLTLFTPASMDVQPQSLGERTFAVSVVLLGLVGFSSLVGRITGFMARLHQISEEKSVKFSLLRHYLKKRHVSQDLCIRIRTYLENRWALQQDVQESNVVVLALLSENLKAELACAIHGPSLTIHPLFYHVQLDQAATMRRLMLRGVQQMSLAPQDMMFNAGEEGTHMSMIIAGELDYIKMNLKRVLPAIRVNAHTDWVAEPVLWVNDWHHLGDLKAATFVEILHIIPLKFLEVVCKNVVSFNIVSQYAVRYVQWLNEYDKSEVSDITKGEILYDTLCSLTDCPINPHRISLSKGGIRPKLWMTRVLEAFSKLE